MISSSLLNWGAGLNLTKEKNDLENVFRVLSPPQRGFSGYDNPVNDMNAVAGLRLHSLRTTNYITSVQTSAEERVPSWSLVINTDWRKKWSAQTIKYTIYLQCWFCIQSSGSIFRHRSGKHFELEVYTMSPDLQKKRYLTCMKIADVRIIYVWLGMAAWRWPGRKAILMKCGYRRVCLAVRPQWKKKVSAVLAVGICCKVLR